MTESYHSTIYSELKVGLPISFCLIKMIIFVVS